MVQQLGPARTNVGSLERKMVAHQLSIIIQVQPLFMHQRFTVYISDDGKNPANKVTEEEKCD